MISNDASVYGEAVKFMDMAIAEAQQAALRGEIPVGAVIVDTVTHKIIVQAGNETEARKDPTAHAEIVAIQRACAIKGAARLPMCDIYVTLEPCPMCAAALSFARVRRVYFGAYDPKSGGVEHGTRFYRQRVCHHAPDVFGGLREERCAQLMTAFFSDKRD